MDGWMDSERGSLCGFEISAVTSPFTAHDKPQDHAEKPTSAKRNTDHTGYSVHSIVTTGTGDSSR
jgi:hypothetical protein